ncbi:hypothetical protein Hdeb2414_s0007g00263081 [Helianthus debilis subsp. tardiflorus]
MCQKDKKSVQFTKGSKHGSTITEDFRSCSIPGLLHVLSIITWVKTIWKKRFCATSNIVVVVML